MGLSSPTVIGRYALFDKIASGGMASVHYGRLLGDSGFSRIVAIKRLHPHLAQDPDFSVGFRDEARVTARIRHPNVVPTLDVVSTEEELFIVMEYVHGESLNRLARAAIKRGERIPPPIAVAIIVGVLHGLHAAHEAVGENGAPLHVVHRDVSPQNILVGIDGIPRLVDFGVAKAAGRAHSTREGTIKGKVAYMAPEQIRGATATRLMDIYGSAVVLWEMLTGERLFDGDSDVTVLDRAVNMTVEAPSSRVPSLAPALDRVVLKGLDRDPERRYRTAKEMARALEDSTTIASNSRVGEWVEAVAGDSLAKRASKVAEIERSSKATSATPLPARVSDPTTPAEPLSFASAVVVAEDPPTLEEPKQEPASVPSKVERSASLSKPPVVIGGSLPPAAEAATGATSSVMRPALDRRVLVACGIGAVSVFFVAVLAVMMHRSRPRTDAAIAPASATAPATAEAPPATATQTPNATATATAIETTPESTSEPPSIATQKETVSAPTTARPVPTHIAAAAPSHPTHTAPAPTEIVHALPPAQKPGCSPPYTVDANGTKHYKVECF
ncbi:MAG: protein kinase domain-containing protein [Polyangiaceae bacterium]